jgi:hypothetical protein
MEDPKPSQPYDVGYSKPPKHTQFKKGQSGNPMGRRRDSKGFSKMLYEELTRPITVTDDNRSMKLPKIQAVIRQAIHRALKGDSKAFLQCLSLVRAHEALESVSAKNAKPEKVRLKGMSVKELSDAYMRLVRGENIEIAD